MKHRSASAAGYHKAPAEVRQLFDDIAPRYDLVNHLMTFGLDKHWRRALVQAGQLAPGQTVLDVACGTGELTLALCKKVVPGGSVVGVDWSAKMLAIAEQKGQRAGHMPGGSCRFQLVDALQLPFAAASFNCATIGFALRNMSDVGGCLAEMRRVVQPMGRVLVLELAAPQIPVYRQLSLLYLRLGVPLIGYAVQKHWAEYKHLYKSLLSYPVPQEVSALMRRSGLRNVHYKTLFGGIVTLHIGEA